MSTILAHHSNKIIKAQPRTNSATKHLEEELENKIDEEDY